MDKDKEFKERYGKSKAEYLVWRFLLEVRNHRESGTGQDTMIEVPFGMAEEVAKAVKNGQKEELGGIF